MLSYIKIFHKFIAKTTFKDFKDIKLSCTYTWIAEQSVNNELLYIIIPGSLDDPRASEGGCDKSPLSPCTSPYLGMESSRLSPGWQGPGGWRRGWPTPSPGWSGCYPRWGQAQCQQGRGPRLIFVMNTYQLFLVISYNISLRLFILICVGIC